VGIHCACGNAALVTPDLAQQRFVGLHTRTPIEKGAEKAHFERGQANVTAPDKDPVGGTINPEQALRRGTKVSTDARGL
jgi:hypothetical protein